MATAREKLDALYYGRPRLIDPPYAELTDADKKRLLKDTLELIEMMGGIPLKWVNGRWETNFMGLFNVEIRKRFKGTARGD